ncbi:amidohydrolase [Candidatus Bathyarchaeota archaeon]|jgi:aminobenzoyl-glutamate utilization protein B|nr:amidohydrolase [Candidatus Bathyarchaeota archaeon]MBT4319431.1 amidohydrolase [Candidatus Bathyarchaeota archaeon]MBT4422931.1 amidohydrolase [Candidatus Bathyarchaeota archaeon]MBT5642343.1 amidohydrolase [Candidatus Bathyarchaeota archaeon]MBT6604212.1 amidohydrolase [Candidatus Bathyarchaeota archaeon]
MVKEISWKWIEDNRDQLISISDKIWGFAEYGLCEDKSSALLAETLKKHGFKVQHGVAGMPTAILAEKGKGKPIIATMGEYDALPKISNNPVPRKDPMVAGGMGHGCGHNIHGTTALAAAIAVGYAMEQEGIEGTIRFYGTPAEENYSGKRYFVHKGLFDDVDAALSHHPSSMNIASLKSSNTISGARFHYHGQSSHAAGNPEAGRSALDAVELMNVGVNYLREHIIPEARIHYVIESGGGQPNVVPDYANSWYYIRAPERDMLEPIKQRVMKIAEGAALMTDTKLVAEMSAGGVHKIPSKVLSEIVTSNMRKVGAPVYTKDELEFAAEIATSFPKENRISSLRKNKVPNWQKYVDEDIITDILDPWDDGTHSAGSTDVSDVSWITPTMEFGTACNVNGAPGHSWQFVACSGTGIGHKSLIFAAKTMAGAALDLFTNPDRVVEAKKELETRLMGREYDKDPSVEPPLEKAREMAKSLQG